MLYQPSLNYTESFSDIKNWRFKTDNSGEFTSGIGAKAWKGLPVLNTQPIPFPTSIATSTNYFVSSFNSGLQQDTSGKTLEILTTGTTDNTNAAAIDFYADFTKTTAGTLSFNWKSVNNFSGDRKASLRVYASIDGANFVEITTAQVLNVTNNSPTSGSIVNVPLPSIFNNSPTARLRFYCYNGTGGSFGSRPKISIDNVSISASVNSLCQTPSSFPANLTFNNITDSSISASFTPASDTTVNSYLIVQSYNAALTSLPVNGNHYDLGANVGDGEVIDITADTFFTASNLYPGTNYYFYIFAVHYGCNSAPLFQSAAPLTADTITLNGNNACAIPLTQPSAINFYNVRPNSVQGSFTASVDADEYLVIKCSAPTLSAYPVKGTSYLPGEIIGNGSVVAKGNANYFTLNNLSPSTTYYIFIFSIKSASCNGGPAYNTSNPLSAVVTTPSLSNCNTPTDPPQQLSFSASNNQISGYFAPSATADSYLILYSTASTLSAYPQDGINYQPGNTIGGASVLSNTNTTAFFVSGLAPGNTYYFYIFAANSNCLGGTKYFSANPLIGSSATTLMAGNNFYYGNLHAHSSYSDGNKDNLSLTPAYNYNYAKNSLCMDFLGISDHNHRGAGMLLGNWDAGLQQARAATTSSFLALYGMEWGIISGGGHVLVYGSNHLFGWENNNYEVYVPINDYTGTPSTTQTKGLFKTINETGPTTFGTLAHPYVNDFNNILNTPYNSTADSAIRAIAIESGPAFSTDTSYNDGAYFEYLNYYLHMLAKGYHIGPTIDHDNHYTTFGRTAKSRLVVVAPAIDSASFYNAIKERHFYATQDCDIQVNFSLNQYMMGSIGSGNLPPAIIINVADAAPSTSMGIPVIRLMSGMPGSGQLAIEIARKNGTTLTYTDYNLPLLNTGYYYADIFLPGNGAHIITAPIWYTKTDNTSPVRNLLLTATPLNNLSVLVTWKTQGEINVKEFMIERSSDGKNYTSLGSQPALGLSEASYTFIDYSPLSTHNYYRIKIRNVDGSFSYSTVVFVNFKQVDANFCSINGNPAHEYIQLNIIAKEKQEVSIRLTDITGKLLLTTKRSLMKGKQIISVDLHRQYRGTHLITVQFSTERITNKVIIN